ncbi:helix-turn-helix domain-containing protein [Enterovibrio sp. ZSDZ35]|uniref:Helix-turn-helix domain-containing protein n=1 Tax=Enterovibrio qingdaonensis TaxID=2899818 RepID=A0ABT5QHG5_9GAMM|nr:helix-turn-helix domain-containing protein [Enterovibrio sp. ZSDZ35]MDD1780403.1 helix-turn-helix domain-containing protein [Enterovibrio sp. ZSDZ35]
MSSTVKRSTYDTSLCHQSEKFAFWRESVCDAYVNLGCEALSRKDFHGKIELSRHDVIDLSFVSGSKHKVIRRAEDIARATDAEFLLSIQLNNRSVIEQCGRAAPLSRYDFTLYSSTEAYSIDLEEDFKQLVIKFPKSALLSRLPDANMLTAIPVNGASQLGNLVANTALNISSLIDSQTTDCKLLLQETLIDLIATSLAPLRGSRIELSQPEQQLLIRAKTFILANLQDASLNREDIAKSLGLSVRRLSEVFARNGETVCGFIRESRMQKIASDLVDERFCKTGISEIAFKWGQNNLQHFSRTFRDQFGCSPRDFRQRKH